MTGGVYAATALASAKDDTQLSAPAPSSHSHTGGASVSAQYVRELPSETAKAACDVSAAASAGASEFHRTFV